MKLRVNAWYKAICAGALALSCGAASGAWAAPVPLRIVVSSYPAYIISLNVTKGVPGAKVDLFLGTQAGCLHDYALTAGDLKRLAGSSVFVANGAGFEPFLDRIRTRYPKLLVIVLTEGIPLLKDVSTGAPNPHVWLSLQGAIAETGNLARGLAAADAGNAALYLKNAESYTATLESLDRAMRSDLAGIKGKKIVTFHSAFAYLARDLGLEVAAVVEREPGAAPSARELAGIITLVRKEGIKAIFAEPQYPVAACEAIARETGAHVYLLDPAVTGPIDIDAYCVIMKKNGETLKRALE